MTTRRTLTACAAAALLAAGLAGCTPENSNPPAGRVVDRHLGLVKQVPLYTLYVRTDAGQSFRVHVTSSTYRACPIGSRWPHCRGGS